jgi:tetratricopeptide (TPR) repeat protein
MPSHIYFALGMWDEAAAINERSVKAADARVAEKKLDVEARGFHALYWLEFAYLQQGRYDEAKAVLGQIEADTAKSGSVRTRSHLALARAAWLIETRRWVDVKPAVSAKGLADEAAAADLFAIGYASLKMGNRIGAQKAMQDLANIMAAAEQLANGAPVNGAVVHETHAATPTPQPQTGLPSAGGAGGGKVPAVIAQQLEAAMLFTEGRREEALVLARQAAFVEDTLAFEFGPPNPVKPAHELAAEMLMDLRRPKEAIEEYTAVLKRNPKRALALLGLARAATAARDQVTAKKAYGELKEVWKKADKTLPELRELAAAPTSSYQ